MPSRPSPTATCTSTSTVASCRGRFALVRRGAPGDREQWLLIHKHDADAVVGWSPEDHPRSVKSGRTNDEVKSAPAATWSSDASWVAPTADEIAALDALPKSGGRWTFGEHTLKLTNLDKVLIPAKRPHRAVTKRDVIRHYAGIAPAMLPYLHDRPINLHRYPDGVDKGGFWHKARPVARPRLRRVLAQRRRRSGRDRGLRRARQPGGVGVGGQLRCHRAAPVDVDGRTAPPPDVGAWSTSIRAPRAASMMSSRWRSCTAPPSNTSASRHVPRSPAVAASRSGSRSPAAMRSTTPADGSRTSPGSSVTWCPSW